MKQNKAIDSIWFNVKSDWKSTIGIVAVDNGHGWKCYIGLGYGCDKELDEDIVISTGVPVGKAIALAAFPYLEAAEFQS
jgi:hypothetical protein